MKFYTRLFILVFSLINTSISYSQQNYFNVPSGEITEKGKIFIQYQINASKLVIQKNLTLDWGLGKGFEAGINAFSLDASTKPPYHFQRNFADPTIPQAPLFLANFQKKFNIGKYGASLGIQAGGTFGGRFTLAIWQYGLISRRFGSTGPLITAGYYTGNYRYLGSGSKWGGMIGFEQRILGDPEKMSLKINADLITGSNSISVYVPGLVLGWKDVFFLSAGAQLPFPGSQSGRAFVIELTYNPKK